MAYYGTTLSDRWSNIFFRTLFLIEMDQPRVGKQKRRNNSQNCFLLPWVVKINRKYQEHVDRSEMY